MTPLLRFLGPAPPAGLAPPNRPLIRVIGQEKKPSSRPKSGSFLCIGLSIATLRKKSEKSPQKKKGIVNPTWDTYQLMINVDGVAVGGEAKTWVITGDNPLAYNEPGQPRGVTLKAGDPVDLGETVSIKPLSVTLLKASIQ